MIDEMNDLIYCFEGNACRKRFDDYFDELFKKVCWNEGRRKKRTGKYI